MIRWRVGRYRQRSVSVQEHNATERELYEGPPPYGDHSHAAVGGGNLSHGSGTYGHSSTDNRPEYYVLAAIQRIA